MNAKQLEIVTKTAVQTALEYLEKEKQKQQKLKRDRRLRNIKLLLRNYRSFKLHCKDLKSKLEELNDSDLLEDLDEELAVNAIRKSKERTLAMVSFIDKMLAVYKVICDQSKKDEDRRSYQTIHLLYISDEKVSAKEIATRHNTDVRTVYRDVDRACKALSVLIFGVDSIRFPD